MKVDGRRLFGSRPAQPRTRVTSLFRSTSPVPPRLSNTCPPYGRTEGLDEVLRDRRHGLHRWPGGPAAHRGRPQGHRPRPESLTGSGPADTRGRRPPGGRRGRRISLGPYDRGGRRLPHRGLVQDRDEGPPGGGRVNVLGTRNVLTTMKELRIPKGVYTSTLAVFSDTRGQLVDETYRYDGKGPWLTEYDRTKWIAHYEVAEPLIREGLPLVIVQPGLNYGPGDTSEVRPTLVRYLRRRLLALPK